MSPRGAVEGTFSLELIHAANGERGADLLFTFPWTSRPNAFGVPGTDLADVSGGARLYASDHGSMSPWNVRNTLLAWGVDFKKRATVHAPAGTVDVTPTILALLGIAGSDGLDGRVLGEALQGGPDEEQIAADTHVHTVEAGAYRAALQVSDGGRAPLRGQELAHPLNGAPERRPRRAGPGPTSLRTLSRCRADHTRCVDYRGGRPGFPGARRALGGLGGRRSRPPMSVGTRAHRSQ